MVVEQVQPNVVVADPIPYITVDTNVTTHSIEPSVYTNGGFPRGAVKRSVLTEYADHVALQLWQGYVYVFYVYL